MVAGEDRQEAGAMMEAMADSEAREAVSGAAMEDTEAMAAATWVREVGAPGVEAGARVEASSGEARAQGAAPGHQGAEAGGAGAVAVR